MDHCDNAKVIITLLDYTSLALFFFSPLHTLRTHTYENTERRTHTDTQSIFSDEQAAGGSVRGLTE